MCMIIFVNNSFENFICICIEQFLFLYFYRNNSVNMITSSSIWFQIWKKFNQTIESPTESLTTEEFHIINTTTSLAHHLDLALINENYQPLLNINVDKLLNKMMSYVLNNVNYRTAELFLSTCGSLVCIKEFSSFSTNDAQTLIAILSLPWMDVSNNIFKLLPLNKFINVIMNKYSAILGV